MDTKINDKTTNVTELTPTEYFDKLKGMKKYIDNAEIINEINNCLELMEVPKKLKQKKMVKKLYDQMIIRIRELQAIVAGFQTYVLRDDIVYYIDKIAKKTVKIIELENYEREIPEDVAEKIVNVMDQTYKLPIIDETDNEPEDGETEKVYHIFDEFFIVFTDYTGEAERTVEKEKRDKDPILFGVIHHPAKDKVPTDRLYYIADWVDEYCDLTLDELCKQYKSKNGKKDICNINVFATSKNGLKEVFKLQDEDYKLN